MTEPSAHLDYAPTTDAPRAARIRRWVKLAIPALLIVAAALLAPRFLRHASVLLAQRQLRAYAAPPTQVVFESDPAEAKKLLAAAAGYTANAARTEAYLVSTQWMQFYGERGGGYQSWGTVYVGELQTKDGRRVLCSLDLSATSAPTNRWVSIGARMIEPGNTYRSPRPVSPSWTRGDGGAIRLDPGDALRVYAGQRDPNDHSHVTIDYVLNGTNHTIDGWLEDTGFMRLELRE